jgi:hypothetical protein
MELELVLKMPAGKPPFIGILFKGQRVEHKAAQIHEHWANFHKDAEYNIILEPRDRWMNIRLVNRSLKCDCLYADIKYKPDVLQRFLAVNKGKVYNFSNLILDDEGKHKVVRTWSKKELFVLKVTKVIGGMDTEW